MLPAGDPSMTSNFWNASLSFRYNYDKASNHGLILSMRQEGSCSVRRTEEWKPFHQRKMHCCSTANVLHIGLESGPPVIWLNSRHQLQKDMVGHWTEKATRPWLPVWTTLPVASEACAGVDPGFEIGGCPKCACRSARIFFQCHTHFQVHNQVWAPWNCDTIITIGINKHVRW